MSKFCNFSLIDIDEVWVVAEVAFIHANANGSPFQWKTNPRKIKKEEQKEKLFQLSRLTS